MEDLTKQQIVLVTLFVSFVTSIATGIVTVSLMQQVPQEVTKTINQVVERTIERVTVPAESSSQAAAVITKETVVVSTEDQAIKAVETNAKSIVKINTITAAADGSGTETFQALGLIVSKEGLIMSDKEIINPNAHYIAVLNNGTEVALTLIPQENPQVALFLMAGEVTAASEPANSTSTSATKKPTPIAVTFADSDSLKLGQSVISLGGKQSTSVSLGIIQSLDGAAGMATTTSLISTTIDPKNILLGSPLLNLSGEIIGFKTHALLGEINSDFLPINVVKQSVARYVALEAALKKAN